MTSQPRTIFATMSVPAKALATCIIVTLAFGMVGALGQIIVHDIIPTFYADDAPMSAGMRSQHREAETAPSDSSASGDGRGDLFADLAAEPSKAQETPFYKGDQFVWTLKWTHIHLFGMNMIFIFLGGLTLFLDIGTKARTWLIVLPFVGVLVDILAMWLKGFVSPAYFWLHVPGGGVFAIIFAYVSLRALWEMWWRPKRG
ncbi:MAG TPA: hypothetical protein VLT88_14075 [Desulfosarcina sp.]|nr:hypothetical protein [Desulfosarcina sp.]